MKKYLKVLFILFLSFIFIPNVFADDHIFYEVKLYEMDAFDFSNDEDETLNALRFLINVEKLNVTESETEGKGYFYDLNGKLLLSYSIDTDNYENIPITLSDDLTTDDNIEYLFTDDDKELLNFGLDHYDGIKLMFAAESNQTSNLIRIENIILEDKSVSAEILKKPIFNKLYIKLNLKFNRVNDYVKYKVIINNQSNEDYKIKENNNIGNSEYITYEYSYDNDSNIAKKNSKKTMYITIKYSKEVPEESFTNGLFVETNNLVIDLSNNIDVPDTLKNPMTGDNYFVILLVFIVSLVMSLILYKITKKKQILSLFFISVALLPISIYALEKLQINIESKIEIKKVNYNYNPCTYDGEMITGAKYINGQYTYYYKMQKVVEFDAESDDVSVFYDSIDEDGWGVTLNDLEAEEISTHLCSSINGKPIVSMQWLFIGSKAKRINLESFDTSNVTNMSYMFSNMFTNSKLYEEIDFSNFDTSNVTNMAGMFRYVGYDATTFDLDLSSFDTSNVTNMYDMFSGAGHDATTFNLDINNWNTSNVTDMRYMFSGAGHDATTFNLDINNWNTSNVTDMGRMFYRAGYNATTFNLNLNNWNTSNVTNMYDMFSGAGYNATTWEIIIPKTNGGGRDNMSNRMFGKGNYNFTTPDTGREFTLSN